MSVGEAPAPGVDRPHLDVDIVCVGFGPATAGFLTTLAREIMKPDGTPVLESRVCPGMPLQVVCYERADDLGFGVSGVVSRARAIRASFPDLTQLGIPTLTPITNEKLVYLLDPIGASMRPALLRLADRLIRACKFALPYREHALELPWIPPFLRKHDGVVFSLGQFLQWVGTQILSTGTVQIWPSTPVSKPIVEDAHVKGVRLVDQGVDRTGKPVEGYTPGMDVRAELVVVGDGPVGSISAQLDEIFGVPDSYEKTEWAIGMKFVVELPENTPLTTGTVLHTFGYPEPGIFGFMYVYPDRIASLGIFVPSWFRCPVRTAYRYLQHWILHPYLWRYLRGGRLRSWGAKSVNESGKHAEPFLVGNGYARIGENSGTTNVLTGSGVDEAWASGVLLAEAVVELLKAGKPFTRANLEEAYVQRRRKSWLEREARIAMNARAGFRRGFIWGMIGMALAGFTGGRLSFRMKQGAVHATSVEPLERFYAGRIPPHELELIRRQCQEQGVPLHDAVMEKAGWPPIPYDGQLLVSHQDVLLLGGKVQAPGGFADHVRFLDPDLCRACREKTCIEACSGQALMPGPEGVPLFDREKCVHCGACVWNCCLFVAGRPPRTNIRFEAGAGGLHSAEN